jgi:AcrR family transcriptional regulator
MILDMLPARVLAPQSEICVNRPPHRAKDTQIRAYIMEAGRNMFIAHGRNGVGIRAFADVTRLAQATIRGHVSDMHHLFGLVLLGHLTAIIAAVGAIPSGRPDDMSRRRAE